MGVLRNAWGGYVGRTYSCRLGLPDGALARRGDYSLERCCQHKKCGSWEEPVQIMSPLGFFPLVLRARV